MHQHQCTNKKRPTAIAISHLKYVCVDQQKEPKKNYTPFTVLVLQVLIPRMVYNPQKLTMLVTTKTTAITPNMMATVPEITPV